MLCMPVVIVAGVCWFFVACHMFLYVCLVCIACLVPVPVVPVPVHAVFVRVLVWVGAGVGLVVWCDKL